MSDLTEDELRVAVMKVDLLLVGFKLGSQPPQSIVVQFQQPLGVKLLP